MGLIGYRNATDDPATYITASVAAGGLNAEALRVPIGSPAVAWQTPGGVTSAALLFIAPVPVAWRAVALCRTNLTTAATLRVQAGDFFGNLPGTIDLPSNINVTLETGSSYDGGTVSAGVVAGVRQALHVMPADFTSRYLLVDIADPTNPDNHLNVPLAYAGPMQSVAIDATSDAGVVVRRSDVATRGGATRAEYLSRQRNWQLKVGILKDTDAAYLDPLEAASAAGDNLLFVPRYPYARAAAEAVFGLLEPGRRGFVDKTGKYRTWSATITERL